MSEAGGPVWGPTWHWQVGGYRFSRYRREHFRGEGLWECSTGGRGVSNQRTPLHAFIALRRWMRVPSRPA